MAYLPYEEDDELQMGQGGLPTTGGVAQVTNPTQAGRFTNFADYFKANNASALGDQLVGGLSQPAEAAKTGAQTAQTDVTTKAAAGTVQGPAPNTSIAKPPAPVSAAPQKPAAPAVIQNPTGGPVKLSPAQMTAINTAKTQPAAPTQPAATGVYDVREPTVVSREDAGKNAEQKYAGPTTDEVDEVFRPLQRQATDANRNISMAKDAAGVKALGGRTGFEATLARAGAGGRMHELQRKYGGLAGSVRDAHFGAWKAADKATTDSATALSGWGGMVGEHDAERKAEADTRAAAQDAYDKRTWGNAWKNFAGWNGLNPNTAQPRRPTGEEFLRLLNGAPPGVPFGELQGGMLDQLGVSPQDRVKMARLIDKLSESELRTLMNMNPHDDIEAFGNALMALAQKHGVF